MPTRFVFREGNSIKQVLNVNANDIIRPNTGDTYMVNRVNYTVSAVRLSYGEREGLIYTLVEVLILPQSRAARTSAKTTAKKGGK